MWSRQRLLLSWTVRLAVLAALALSLSGGVRIAALMVWLVLSIPTLLHTWARLRAGREG